MFVEAERPSTEEIVFAKASAYAERARVVPYVLGLSGDPNKLLTENKGNCTRKHLYLAKHLINLGYQVDLGFASFDWTHLPIPRKLGSILKDSTDTHLFLYATFNGKESLVDVAWDPLMPAGFSSRWWDGKSSMLLGVPALKIWRQDIQSFRVKAAAGKIMSVTNDLFFGKSPTPFNDAFNAWLGRSVR